MKTATKLNLLLIGLFFISTGAAKAWNQSSELNLKMFDNSAFTVFFDNNNFQYPDNSFSISNVKPGKHFLKVIKHIQVQKYHGYRGGKTTYSQVVYNGWITVPASSKVFAMIGKYNNYNVINVISLKPAYNQYSYPAYSCGNNSYGHACNTSYEQYYNSESDCAAPKVPAYLVMNDKDFYALKNIIANTSFDSNRLMIAKQAVANNYLTSAQVAELAGTMSFESSRLELAKHAYKFTVDKQNYFLVNNAFSFSSSVYELNRYINSVG